MRNVSLLALMATPALICAQTPTNLAEAFNRELPAINTLLSQLKAPEALAKAEALIPGTTPAYNTSSLPGLQQSAANYRGLARIYQAAGNAAACAGDWEKALGYYQKAAGTAKENKDTFGTQAGAQADKALASIKEGYQITKDQWEKMKPDFLAKEAEFTKTKETLTAKPKRTPEDENVLKQVTELIPKIQGDVKANDEKLVMYQKAIGQNEAVLKQIQEFTKELEGEQKKYEQTATDIETKIKTQKDEIEKFNQNLLKKNKKAKIDGNKTWVDAVVAQKDNLSGKTPTDQSNLLRRLLFLDAGNKNAQKALDNVLAGKDPFAKEEKAKGKGKKK